MLRFIQRTSGIAGGPVGDLPEVLSGLLRGRGIDTPEKAEAFLHPRLDMLFDPFLMPGMDRAAAILRAAQAEGTPVQIYGDYDCDGVTATAIMLETLREMGIPAEYRIPSRHSEGYGLNVTAVREISEALREKYGCPHPILLTVDCGVTNHEEVRLARRLGMTVIVTDHHQLPEEPSPADVVLNPLLGNYPDPRLCGAGVALKLTQALLGMEAVEKRLDLAAIATIADIVPLVRENRVIVSKGLRALGRTARPGLKCMLAGMRGNQGAGAPITSGQVAFGLAPRINAGGRLEDAAQCVELLTTRDEERAAAIARNLEEQNQARQALQEEITRAAEARLAEETDFLTDRVIIVMGEGWNSGVIGLAAGKLCEKYHYPTIILSRSGDLAVGSCRSIRGVNIHAMLTTCADLFERFGGHEMAAGLTIRAERVPEMRRRLNLAIEQHCDPACYVPEEEYDCAVPLAEVTEELIDGLALLQPTGFGNPAPALLLKKVTLEQARPVGREGRHLKLTVSDGDVRTDGIAFGMGELARQGLRRADLLVSPEMNEFRGVRSVQVQVKALQPSAGAAPLPEDGAVFSALVQELTLLASNQLQIPDVPAKEAGDEKPPLKDAALKRMCEAGMGVLMIAHEKERATAVADLTQPDIALGSTGELRPFNTLLLNPVPGRLRDSWRHIVLVDGDLLPGEAEALRRQCPRAELHVSRPNEALLQQLLALALDKAALRPLLRSLKKRQSAPGPLSVPGLCGDTGLTPAQVSIGLTILAQAGLAEYIPDPWQVRLLPWEKGKTMDPEAASPLMRYLLRL